MTKQSQSCKIEQLPVNWVQRIALYVTDSRYYLVGSNNTQTAFKVLKIDRTDNDLSLVDDRTEYTYQEIRELLWCLDHGNRTPNKPVGITKTFSSFGLLGFVRFLHGYYLILIIKRRKVAAIGYHTIYKIEETKLVYIPNKQPTSQVNEESKYVKAFSSIDLSSNFYFSYSYDISQTLQYNLSPIDKFDNQRLGEAVSVDGSGNHGADYSLMRSQPRSRFVWNLHLIDQLGLHDDWKINLIHGFIAQANICVYSRPIYITLIARRSRRYCGTRFLKRGLNLDGDVANEVETEQIVHDASVSSFEKGLYTSFVQLRGSLPDRWSQDATKIVPKPPILLDFVDPYHEATAKHFDDLFHRYGTPIVALNLIKQKEVKAHESVLNDMINKSVRYLNQFLPQQHIIRLISFDMARCNKSRNDNVMQRLGKIGFNIVRVTGFFQSWRSHRNIADDPSYVQNLRRRDFERKPSSARVAGYRLRDGQCLQNGLVRVNCVDSLDRTNTAQFALGKVALGFQLQALGVLNAPTIEYDTDAVRLLEQLYEDHGDTIALQYGGSQLVHRVKTYRKVAPITSHSSEIMQTLSRYYSNTFSDAEKQSVINLFLGVRRAVNDNVQAILSDVSTDYYLHNQALLRPFHLEQKVKSYTQWWDQDLLKCLPMAHYDYTKKSRSYRLEVRVQSPTFTERIDLFLDAYRPYEITYLASSFSNQILHTIKDFMPNGATHYSPFCLRLGPGKLKEKYLKIPPNKRLPPNPSVSGLPSTSSLNSELSLLETTTMSDDSDLDDLKTHPTALHAGFRCSSSLSHNINSNYTLMRYLSEYEPDNTASEADRDVTSGGYGDFNVAIAATDLHLYEDYCRSTKSRAPADMGANFGTMWTDRSLNESAIALPNADAMASALLVEYSKYIKPLCNQRLMPQVGEAEARLYEEYVQFENVAC